MAHAIVIGAGHNGLVCALVLARNGYRVTVLESFERPGGCVATESLGAGHRVNVGALELAGFAHGVGEQLNLDVPWIASDYIVAADRLDGRTTRFHSSLERTVAMLPHDSADQWRRYCQFATRVNGVLGEMQNGGALPLGDLASLGSAVLGDNFLRTLFSPSDVVAGAWLDDETLRDAVTAYGSHGEIPSWMTGSGSFALWLPGVHGTPRMRPRGGSGALVDALVGALSAAGGTVRCNCRVAEITVVNDRVRGVSTTDGMSMSCDVVVSSIDVVRTASLLSGATLEHPPLTTGRHGVGELKVDVALDRAVTFDDPDDGWTGAMRMIGPEHQGQAYRSIVAGICPDPLPLLACVVSADDVTMAPPGKSTAWLSAFVPEAVDVDVAVHKMMASMDVVSPGFSSAVTATKVTGPRDWEARTGNRFGNPNHLDLTIDQLLSLRPSPHTPVDGLWLSGAGIHPGGGVTGQPGWITANQIVGGQRSRRDVLTDRAKRAGRLAQSTARLWKDL
jgi:beta-carotene ketolase (CrtO type)